jgi:hypothetical protein
MHVYIEKYRIFSKLLFAVKTARQSFGKWIIFKVEYYEILHILTKIHNFSTLVLKDMEFLVTLSLLSNSPDSKAISEFSGMIASALSLSWIPIGEGTRFYIPCLKMMIFMWWKNAPRMFLKFLSTAEHNRCKVHLSSSSLRIVSNRSIPISLPSQVEPRCTLLIAYTPFLQYKGDPPTS